MDKKAQLTLTFNWIYVLVAGAIILLFFASIVVQQKASADEKLSSDITQILESILTGAGVSEQTKNIIPTPALKDFTLTFTCELDKGAGFKDIFSGYGVKDSSSTIETPVLPLFAPAEILSTELVTWSLPYDLPFKIMDLLFLSSGSTQYYVIGNDATGFKAELEETTEEFNFAFIDSFNEINAADNYHVRIIEFAPVESQTLVTPGSLVPGQLRNLANSQVSVVQFTSRGGVVYYDKQGSQFRRTSQEEIKLVSMGPNKRDAAKFALIFAGNEQAYRCNMMKVFKRLGIVAEVYQKKFEDLQTHYVPGGESNVAATVKQTCYSYLDGENSVDVLASAAITCAVSGECAEDELVNLANDVENLNDKLRGSGCITLY